MQWLAEVCVKRPVFAAVLMLLLVVVGIAGYSKLGVDEFPNVDIPIVVVTARLPGSAPQEMESDVADKLEAAVNTIAGIEELRSTSSEGVTQLVLSFAIEKSVDVAAQEVRDKIALAMVDLPKGIDTPVVSKVDPSASAVLLVAVKSNRPLREMTEIADTQIRRQLESIPGVGQVTLAGGRKRQLNLWLDPLALRNEGLTGADVQRAVASQNLSTPGGNLQSGPRDVTVRVEGRVTSPEALGRVVVRENAGHATRVEDVTRVEDGVAEESSYAALDGAQTIVLGIRKQAGQNTVAVVDAVKARLGDVQRSLPSDVALEIVRDNSAIIRTSTHAVTEHLILGAVFAAVVVLVFLGNVRSTLIAAVAIPISIVGTFGIMWAWGFTLNVLTLLALALAVGIVIDDAIVVLENIVKYIDEKGMKPFPAAVLATREIGMAVLATTLSLMAVFVPVGFMGGMVGKFLASFGFTMAFAIGVSLVVSFTLTPMLSARWLTRADPDAAPGLATQMVNRVYRPIERAYMALLRFAMGRRWIVVVACALALGSCGPLAKGLPSGFLPPDDKAQFEINLRAPEGSSVTETRLVAERVLADVRTLPAVQHTLLTVGDDDRETANLAKIYVFLTDPKTRKVDQLTLMNQVRQTVIPHAPKDLRITVGEVQSINTGSSSATVSFALAGPDLDGLTMHATRIVEKLRQVPGAVDVDSTLLVGKPSLDVRIDRDRAADLGIQVADIADALRLFVGGQKISTYAENGESYDVRLRADARFRDDEDKLALVSVPSSKLGRVPLRQVVSLHPSEGPSEINRIGRRRQITISANAAPGVGDSVVAAALKDIVAKENLPASYSFEPVGTSKESAKMAAGFALVIGLAFVFMYLILAAQFESWLHPVTILVALPLTVPFALLSLHLFGQSLNLFSGLGLLVLFGVVKKNAILQIDHTNQLRAAGLPRAEAILQANQDRLRPILMTTLAFVAGMVPLMLSKGVGAGQNQATAGIVLGGQTLSLVLTLVATPVFYSLFDDAAELFGRLFRRLRGARAAVEVDRGEGELDDLEAVVAAHAHAHGVATTGASTGGAR
jgi:hydrophobe/amphiphile efflux-1 (HAE1) family protein